VDYAYYLRGLINFDRNPGFVNSLVRGDEALRDQSTSKQSFLDFGDLLKRYPNSQYATDARQRMLYLRNNLATYELSVAQYYLRRGANVGAVNRAKFVVETYQETPMAADALAVMVQGYEALGEEQLAQDALLVLRANAPDHPYITGVVDQPKRGWLGRLWPFGKGRAP
jgi:outer membrane protein assembly factor BamD